MPALQSNRALDADVDADGRGLITLKPEYRDAIAAAIPSGVHVPADFWDELASTVAAFSISQQLRASRPPSAEVERWKHIEKLESDLADAYESAGRSPPVFEAVIDANGKHHRRSTRMVEAYKSANIGFERKSDMHRDALYLWILALWHRKLEQELSTTRDKDGSATEGAMFKFFTACTEPLTDKRLTPSGLSKVVSRLL